MRQTVDECQSKIAAIVDQDQDTGNISTADYALRLKFMNMAQKEWAETYDSKTLYKEYHMNVSTATGNASIVLPNDFRKLASYPLIVYDGATTGKFTDVLPTEDNQYSSTDKRVNLLGNPNSGYILRVKGVDLTSGASVMVPYFKSPASLSTGTNIPDIPNADYLVQKTIALLWESQEDSRFPQAKAEAERILQNLLEFENVPGRGAEWDRVKTVEESRYNFRMGRD